MRIVFVGIFSLFTFLGIYLYIENAYKDIGKAVNNMGKIKTSISIEEETWKEFKKKCIDKGKQYSVVLEELMKKFVKE